LVQAIAYTLRIEIADLSPTLGSVAVKVDKGWREFESISRRQFAADLFLNVQAYDQQSVSKFIFELVNDGL